MFDPNLPQENTPADAAQMRGQLNGLKSDYEAQIAAIPVGPPGPPGQPFATVIVDSVTTLGPDEPATAVVSFDGTNVHLSLGIPRGHDGTNGNDGAPGGQGPGGGQGDPGPTGPPFANLIIDSVTTLGPDDAPTA